jgi:hypothetical protein
MLKIILIFLISFSVFAQEQQFSDFDGVERKIYISIVHNLLYNSIKSINEDGSTILGIKATDYQENLNILKTEFQDLGQNFLACLKKQEQHGTLDRNLVKKANSFPEKTIEVSLYHSSLFNSIIEVEDKNETTTISVEVKDYQSNLSRIKDEIDELRIDTRLCESSNVKENKNFKDDFVAPKGSTKVVTPSSQSFER